MSFPIAWPMERAKWLLERKSRPPGADDGVVTAFRDGQVTLRTNRRIDGFTEAVQEIGYQGIRKGDLVVHSMDGFAGAIGISDSDGKASPVVHAYKVTAGADARFFAYFLRAMAKSGYIESLAKGIRERSTSFDAVTLANLQMPCPPLDQQRSIADFLDTETARIDRMVELRRSSRSLIEEKAFTCIARLSTTGRGAVQSTEDPWIPQVGVGWDVLPLKRRWRIIDCKHRTPRYIDYGHPVISPGDITPGRLDPSKAHRFVDENDYHDLADTLRRARRGDIVYSRNASIGIAAYVDTDEKFTMGQDVCRITSTGQNQLFLTYFLNTAALAQLGSLQIGSTFTRVNIGTLLELSVACPPREEQSQLATEMDAISLDAARLTFALDSQIALLAERRQALITAAVTGGITV